MVTEKVRAAAEAVKDAITGTERCGVCGGDMNGEEIESHRFTEQHVTALERQATAQRPRIVDTSAPTITGDLPKSVKETLELLKVEVDDVMTDLTIETSKRPFEAARRVRATFAKYNWPNEQYGGTVLQFLRNDCAAPVLITNRGDYREPWFSAALAEKRGQQMEREIING